MSDYTPTLGRVRTVYMDHRLDCLFADCTESMAQAEFDRAIAKVRAEAKAEALREAADSLDAHAHKNEREVRQTAWGTPANIKGTYWAVYRVRITARWLRVRATNLAVR